MSDATHENRSLISRYGTRIGLAASAVAVVAGLTTIVVVVSAPEDADTNTEVVQVITGLEKDLVEARGQLRTAHEDLLNQLPAAAVDRMNTDAALGRSLALSVATSSSSTLTPSTQTGSLLTRYPGISADAQTLTSFISSWMEATRGTTFELVDANTELIAVQSLTRTYLTIAQLQPVAGAHADSPEILAITFTTREDGTLSALEINRASEKTRTTWAKS